MRVLFVLILGMVAWGCGGRGHVVSAPQVAGSPSLVPPPAPQPASQPSPTSTAPVVSDTDPRWDVPNEICDPSVDGGIQETWVPAGSHGLPLGYHVTTIEDDHFYDAWGRRVFGYTDFYSEEILLTHWAAVHDGGHRYGGEWPACDHEESHARVYVEVLRWNREHSTDPQKDAYAIASQAGHKLP